MTQSKSKVYKRRMFSPRLLLLQQVFLLLQPAPALGGIFQGLQGGGGGGGGGGANGFSDFGTQLLNGAIGFGQQIGLVPPGAGQTLPPPAAAPPAQLPTPVVPPVQAAAPVPTLTPAPMIAPFSIPPPPAVVLPPPPTAAFADFESRLSAFGQRLGLIPSAARSQTSPPEQGAPSPPPPALAPQVPTTTSSVAFVSTPAAPASSNPPQVSTTPSPSPSSSSPSHFYSVTSTIPITTSGASMTTEQSSPTSSASPVSVPPTRANPTNVPAAESQPPQASLVAPLIPFIPIFPAPQPQQPQPGGSSNSTRPSGQGPGMDPSQPGEPVVRISDFTQGSFLGEVPTREVDLPVTIIFLVLFVAGAITHMSIYQTNSRRGHKFLLSDVLFDFCVVRALSCVFRIAWIFQPVKGVIVLAVILQTGGAAVAAILNIFFAQRLLRSMHPRIGWHPAVGPITTTLAFSVPAAIIWQIANMLVLFFTSVDDTTRPGIIFKNLEAGSAYVLFLMTFPILVTSVVTGWPGPRPEPFGIGDWRVKKSIIVASGLLLTVGAGIRLSTLVNPEVPGSHSPVFSRATFYTTQFMLEIFVIALYAAARVDLLFHVPNGSSKPGDYSGRSAAAADEKNPRGPPVLRDDVEAALDRLDAPYEILRRPPPFETRGLPPGRDVVWALVSVDKPKGTRGVGSSGPRTPTSPRVMRVFADTDSSTDGEECYSPTQPGVRSAWTRLSGSDGGGARYHEREVFPAALPQRPTRVSRRASVLEAIRPRIMRARQEEQQRAAAAAMDTAAAGDADIPVTPSPVWSSSPDRPSYVSFDEEEDEFYRRTVVWETIPVCFPEVERSSLSTSSSTMSKD